jgi:hypothetical protein
VDTLGLWFGLLVAVVVTGGVGKWLGWFQPRSKRRVALRRIAERLAWEDSQGYDYQYERYLEHYLGGPGVARGARQDEHAGRGWPVFRLARPGAEVVAALAHAGPDEHPGCRRTFGVRRPVTGELAFGLPCVRRTASGAPIGSYSWIMSNGLPKDVNQILEYLATAAQGYNNHLKWNEEAKLKGDLMNAKSRWRSVPVTDIRDRCRALGMREEDVTLIADLVTKAQAGRRLVPQSSYRDFRFDPR